MLARSTQVIGHTRKKLPAQCNALLVEGGPEICRYLMGQQSSPVIKADIFTRVEDSVP